MPLLSDLFSMRYGHSLELNRLTRADHPQGVNFVSRAMGNNGVTARVEVPDGVAPAASGELTVALSGNGVLSTFVQPEPFLCGFHVAILTPKRSPMPLSEKLWWARCIYANRYRYSYGRQANRSLMGLSLPDAIPQFVSDAVVPEIGKFAARSIGSGTQLPPSSSWKTWRLGQLFDIRKGRRIIAREREEGKVPFVATTTRTNGIVSYVDGEPMFPAGSISVPYNGQGGVGYAFYQPKAFSASDDVQVLVPPAGVDAAALLFVCAVLRHERYRYSFGRKWHMDRMRETVIKLPSKDSHEPDWALMSQYMKGLPFAAGALG